MLLGLYLTQFNWPEGGAAIGARVAAIARAAEEAGFDAFWSMDHFYGRPVEEPMLEGYSVLAFAAAATRRIKLGALVTGVTYRHPGVLVKTVTTLDVLSGGRAWLGLGAAWHEREHLGLGVPFPPLAERFERLEETLRIAKQMWSGEVAPFVGKHYHLDETLCRPLPIQRPHPPILVGGGGERKTLRLVARYADACNLSAIVHPDLPGKLEALRRFCAEVGRPYAAIAKTCLISLPVASARDEGTISPAEAVDRLGALAEIGFDQAIVMMPEPLAPATADVFGARIVPEAAKLAVAGR
jgi:F420-dependent oxidoreductase-like protein